MIRASARDEAAAVTDCYALWPLRVVLAERGVLP